MEERRKLRHRETEVASRLSASGENVVDEMAFQQWDGPEVNASFAGLVSVENGGRIWRTVPRERARKRDKDFVRHRLKGF